MAAVDGEGEQQPLCSRPGCDQIGTKKCTRCCSVAYCSADCQRKAWAEHKLVCKKVDSVDNDIRELLKSGKLYSARERLKALPTPNKKLEAELEELIALGIHSEIIDDAIEVNDVGDMGRGYVTKKAIPEGSPILFDTGFLSVPVDGNKAMHERMWDKLAKRLSGEARRRSAKADAQADFFYSTVKELPLKGNMDRSILHCKSMSDEENEQMVVFSICEGCALFCTEEPQMAIFPKASFFNHSCAPNALMKSDRSSLLVTAARDLSAGEEVFISYLPLSLLERPKSDRRYRLQGGRGFECTCSRCLSESDEKIDEKTDAKGDAEGAVVDFESLPKLTRLGAATPEDDIAKALD